jgi:hypothetical protein
MDWATVNNVPANIDTMLLLTDGSVMAHGLASSNWYRLIPDQSGSYANGTWKQTASMLNDSSLTATMNGPTYGPVFFGSAVLQDGTVLVFGGEYNVLYTPGAQAVDALEVQLYDPLTDSWTILLTPSGWTNIGDSASTVLADGRVLFGNAVDSQVVTFDPQTQAYFPTAAKNDATSEETFTLLPTGDVLTVQCSGGTDAELYTPSTDFWLQMGRTGPSLPQPCPNVSAGEIGPAILLPDGNVFCIGASGNTASYKPGAPGAEGTWSNGPTLLDTSNSPMYPMDAPAVLLTDGTVLLTASPGPPCTYPSPTTFYIYDPSTNGASITTAPSNSTGACFTGRFLLLPSGEVLYSNQTDTVSILSSVGGVQAGWAPTITNCPITLILGHTYQIFGTQFNGLSQACSYGDDAQMATNYPIVRLQDVSGNVQYLRTANHSTMGVATGTTEVSTFVSVPTDIPPGAYNLFVVANGISSAPFEVSVGTQDLVIRLEMTNFTVGEVMGQQSSIGAGNFADALNVEVEGFSQNAIGTTVPTVPDPIGGLSYVSMGPGSPSDPTLPADQPQRFTFPFQAQFSGTGMFTSTDQTLVVSAKFAPPGSPPVSNQAQIVLQASPNPYMLHGGSGPGAEWFLSVDIKVFQLKAGDTLFGLMAAQGNSPQDGATAWIQATIDNLNGDPKGLGPAFDALPADEDVSALNLLQADTSGNNIYNFALARVRYQDSQTAPNVRLFFRMFATQQVTSAYDPTTTYFSATSGSSLVPVLGVVGDEIVTIPFFAAPRVDVSQPLSAQPDPKNIWTIGPDPTGMGAVVDTYYGCWLDINQPGDARFPDRMVGNTPADYPYGPYGSFDNLVSILQLVRSQHQCLVCEVSFDGDLITPGDDPSNTDKLAQRNLAFVSSANPGVDPSRLIPQTFELKPTPAILKLDQKPDELVIDWRNVPHGSIAQIYLPGTASSAVLSWAAKLYTTRNLRAFDSHTIEVNTGGTTYIPIPKGTNVNFAGLLSIQLPQGVKKGDKYEVIVRQVTSVDYRQPVLQTTKHRGRKSQAVAEPPPSQYAWRRTSGIFKLTIPVDTRTGLLETEERYYAILQFIAKSIPLVSRWYPVFQRYLTQVAGRVAGFGGYPGKILPSGTGSLPGDGKKHPVPRHHDHLIEFVGKVAALIYNHFGDFEGFVLEEGCNRVRRFESRECRLASVLREAWKDRAVVRVITDSRDESCVLEVVVGGQPPTCC